MEKMSVSHEDYLEAIVMLGGVKAGSSVRAVDIATKMGVSKASVSKAVSALKEKGLVTQPFYGDISLTEEGAQYGRKVLNRHRMLTLFLSQAVGIDPSVAEEEACKMEHAISDESFEKWITFIEKLNLSCV
jgi:Mn-dependent DtxR family transcriptional regulator